MVEATPNRSGNERKKKKSFVNCDNTFYLNIQGKAHPVIRILFRKDFTLKKYIYMSCRQHVIINLLKRMLIKKLQNHKHNIAKTPRQLLMS